MKKHLSILLLFVLSAMLYGCSNSKAAEQMNYQTVNTMLISNQSVEAFVSYTGTVSAKETKNLSFESGGTVSELLTSEGQKIHSGQVLARLDTKNLQLALINAQNQSKNASNAVLRTQNAIETAKVTLAKTEATYNANIKQSELSLAQQKNTFAKAQYQHKIGEISDYEFSAQKAQLDTLQNQLDALKSNRDNDLKIQNFSIEDLKGNLQSAIISQSAAGTALDKAQKDLNAAVITAPFDGYVLKTPVKQGEMTGAGSPVVVVKTEQVVINIGVPVEKINLAKTGLKVAVKTSDKEIAGKISQVSLYPDETTHTYNVEILPDDQTLPLGSLLTIKLPSGKINGCFVPISAVLNLEGVDYIYSVEASGDKTTSNAYKTVRQQVQLGNIYEDMVEIKNISSDLRIIADGVKDIRENETVIVKE